MAGPAREVSQPAFGGNFFVDPCNGCNYDSDAGGFDVRGPRNCTAPGSTNWMAVPFIAQRTGVPRRISAAILLHNPDNCPYNKVTLSIYTDNNCEGLPGTPLVSVEATVPLAPCDLAVAKLPPSILLEEGKKYWVTATTSEAQAKLEARWWASNNAQLAANLGIGWFQFSSGTPAFLVE